MRERWAQSAYTRRVSAPPCSTTTTSRQPSNSSNVTQHGGHHPMSSRPSTSGSKLCLVASIPRRHKAHECFSFFFKAIRAAPFLERFAILHFRLYVRHERPCDACSELLADHIPLLARQCPPLQGIFCEPG